jgi:hypothetical protein|tara:strand:- start:612 stop:770 length:159 start_codon:yes stop_codon:yes gene_type:complete
VQGYTLAQIQLFAEESALQDRARLRDMAIASRAAQQDQNNWQKFMRSVDEQG